MVDLVVVGAGLSGLSAGVAAAERGCSVTVVDALERPGGLCGSWWWEGNRLPIACCEFSLGMAWELRRMGVRVPMRKATSRLYLGGGPTNVAGAAAVVLACRRDQTIADALSRPSDNALSRVLGALCATAGIPLDAMPTADLRARIRLHAVLVGARRHPLGGSHVVIEALMDRLHALGGVLRLGAPVSSVVREGDGYVVQTGGGLLEGRAVVSCRPRWEALGPEAPRGLEFAQLALEVEPGFGLPDGQTGLYDYPAPISDWLGALAAGSWPETIGYHLFQLPPDSTAEGPAVIGGYLLVPRGVSEIDPERTASLVEGVLERAFQRVPGLERALRRWHLVDPAEFRTRHGLAPVLLARLPPAGTARPPAVDPETGVRYLSGAVGPAVDHACGAVRLGRRAGLAAALQR